MRLYIFLTELKFSTQKNLTFEFVKSEIKLIYRKACFMRKAKKILTCFIIEKFVKLRNTR